MQTKGGGGCDIEPVTCMGKGEGDQSGLVSLFSQGVGKGELQPDINLVADHLL